MSSIPQEIAALVEQLNQEGYAVWLLGSRANGTAGPDSDWDLLVFGNQGLLGQLQSQVLVKDVDLLVVVDGDEFLSPWNRTKDGVVKSGSLSGWRWKFINEDQAVYSGTKWPDDWGTPKWAERLRT